MSMNKSQIVLPSNRKFGFFFSAIFTIYGAWSLLFKESSMLTGLVLIGIGILLLVVTLLKADFLLPLNKLWMRFGHLLGMVVSPIILGVFFFGLFTPIGLGMRLFGRDELCIKRKKRISYWRVRTSVLDPAHSFENQF